MRLLRRPTVTLQLTILLFVLVVSLLATPATVNGASLTDIEGSWAREEIETLIDQGVVNGYPDGTFHPEQYVTRAEFAKMMTRAFENIQSGTGAGPAGAALFPDVEGHWAAPYISGLVDADVIDGRAGGKFRPDQPITHAEMATMLIRAIAPDLIESGGSTSPDGAGSGTIGASTLDTSSWQQSFTDVDRNNPAFGAIELANRLEIIPPAFINEFAPDRPTTRAEAASMIVAAQRVGVRSGEISGVNAAYGTVSLASSSGVRVEITLNPTALVYRNGVSAELSSLQDGDEARVISDADGRAQLLQAYGLVTRDDVFGKVTELTQGVLTKEQLHAIANGNWDQAQAGLRATVYDRLLEIGATPAEAESILMKDWNSLTSLAKERLARAVSAQYGVSPALVDSLLSGQWEIAWQLIQDEAMTQLLSSLLI